jgi:tol-pal system protein YbgF
MSPKQTRILLLTAAPLALGLALAGVAPALAQRDQQDPPQPAVPYPDPSELLTNKGIERRLERDEKDLRELRRIVLQSKAQGNPVEVKDAGPDPQVEALQSKVNELEETLRRQTGQLEVLLHDSQLAGAAVAAANQTNQALAARLDAAERQLQALSPQQPQQPQAYGGAPPPPGGGTGVLGTLPAGGQGPSADAGPAPDAGPGDEATAYRAARQTLDSGDYAGGAQALQDYLQHYPNSPRAQEANYWLGRTLALRNMHAEAAAAYARALRGWPQTSWAGDAVVRLSASLIELKRGSDACRALAEYETRYNAKAAPALKARARDTRAQAACA